MIDPRLLIIEKRFEKIGKVKAISSGKGGVGKSLIATCLALNLKEKGFKVGLLDLDFTSPSTHVILGINGIYPEEKYGIIPPLAHGIRYMSITHYSLDEPAPLRGIDVSNAIIELLAITRWDDLDYLIIDMPPGIGDATLDTIRLIPKLEFIIITTPSIVAYQSVRRLIILLQGLGISINGVIENIVMNPTNYIESNVRELESKYIGKILYDHFIESSLGDVNKIIETDFYKKLAEITLKIL